MRFRKQHFSSRSRIKKEGRNMRYEQLKWPVDETINRMHAFRGVAIIEKRRTLVLISLHLGN